MQSMTGFGRGDKQENRRQLTIELRSVNHRYLDLSIRTPRLLHYLEDPIRKTISTSFERGHIDVFVNYKNNRDDAKKVVVDDTLLLEYQKAMTTAFEKTGLMDDRTLCQVLSFPDIVRVEESEEDEEIISALMCASLQEAINDLKTMRIEEGKSLANNILDRLNELEKIVESVEVRSSCVVQEYQVILQKKITALMEDGTMIDPQRLAMEVAIMADKSCIDEEVVRLKSHFAQMRDIIASAKGAIGRKLDFIVQEMNREFNTIGSKAGDLAIINAVIDGKAYVEKIREQVQNIE